MRATVTAAVVFLFGAACQPAEGPPATTVAPSSPPTTESPITETTTTTTVSAASTTVAAVSHPEPRGFAQLVYHPPSGHFLLFGGEANQRFSYEETWSYDVMANEWTDLDPEVQPRRAGGETIVYDSESDRFIAYFNTRLSDTAPSGLEPMSETWIYDLTDSAWSLAGP